MARFGNPKQRNKEMGNNEKDPSSQFMGYAIGCSIIMATFSGLLIAAACVVYKFMELKALP